MDIVIQAEHLSKEFVRDEQRVTALADVDLIVERGSFTALMGPSGSGKSTLLHLIAAIDRPSGGDVRVLGQDARTLSGRALGRWRNAHIGFVFQSFNLIPVLTALENVALPLKLTTLSARDQLDHATTSLELVGLGDRLHHFPRQLSGGQEQRVAVARAIATDPDLLLADEPTGNLDATSAIEILELLSTLHREYGKTVIMVTHDARAAHYASTIRYLDKGVLLAGGQTPREWNAPPAGPAADRGPHEHELNRQA